MASAKGEIRNALIGGDFAFVTRLASSNRRVFSILISLAYDKEDTLCWRAIEAMGKAAGVVALHDAGAVRTVVQRLLWSLSEESGGIGWSAPEMLGEIVVNCPDSFPDIPPIILSFHGEEMFLAGVLWAVGRMAERGIRNGEGAREIALQGLTHRDPVVRGMAAWSLARLGEAGDRERLKGMTGDEGRVRIYEGSALKERTVGDIVREILQGRGTID